MMNAVTILNILVVIILLAFLYSGYKEGFARKLIGIFSFFVVGILSWYASGLLSNIIFLYPKQEDSIINVLLYDNLNRITLFVVLFVLFQVVLLILKPITKLWNHVPVISILNRLAGCLLGGAQALLLLFLLTMGLRLPLWDEGSALASKSLLRYSDPLADLVLFYTKEPVEELQKIEESLEQTQAFTSEEAQRLEKWLLENNISKEDADKILSMLRVE